MKEIEIQADKLKFEEKRIKDQAQEIREQEEKIQELLFIIAGEE